MKIQRIEVKNFKAISEQEINFKGCSAIITAGNNKGKSSLLRGFIDRIQGKKADIILKRGEKNGFQTIELTDGCKIEWNFTESSEKFTFTTKDGIQVKTGVISMLQERYFGKSFDIDLFINSQPKQQQKTLCDLLGINLAEIDSRYKIAYDLRTDAKKELANLISAKKTAPEKVEKPDIESLKSKKAEIQTELNTKRIDVISQNRKLRDEYEAKCDALRVEIESFNKIQDDKEHIINGAISYISSVNQNLQYLEDVCKFTGKQKISLELRTFLDSLENAEERKTFEKPAQPEYLSETIDISKLEEIEKEIEAANEKMLIFSNYERDFKEYNDWIEKGKKARENVEKCEADVKQIEVEKQALIENSKMPDGFSFGENGLLYNGFELSKNSQSSSALYIAGLKLATMNLGELKTIHFDASFLDKNSLFEVEQFAQTLDLQLLIERPDYDGGEIKYEII